MNRQSRPKSRRPVVTGAEPLREPPAGSVALAVMRRNEFGRRGLLALAGVLAAVAPAASRAAADWYLPWRWRARLLIVFAPSEHNRLLQQQRSMLSSGSAGSAERSLASMEVIGDHSSDSRVTGRALRLAFAVPRDRFTVILVGRDGDEKMRSTSPVSEDRLFEFINSMTVHGGEEGQSAQPARTAPRSAPAQ